MKGFTFACIGVGTVFIGGILFLIGSIVLKKNLNHTGRKGCLTWAILLIISAAILAGVAFIYFEQCPNPACNEWVNSAYCQKCGWEVNAPINCLTCEKQFDTDKVPAFCPDCGTQIKE